MSLTPVQQRAVDEAADRLIRDLTRAACPDGCDGDTHLLTLAAVARRVEVQAADQAASAVRAVRRRQVSWARIGTAVGMSKQGAAEKRAYQPRPSGMVAVAQDVPASTAL